MSPPNPNPHPGLLIDSLNTAIRRGTTLAWCMEHGSDALPKAWREAAIPGAMATLLFLVGETNGPFFVAYLCDFHAHRTLPHGCVCDACADLIRARHPEMTFAKVMEAIRAQ